MKRKGFTIVELIIVIAVIGVLAAILIPTFANVIKKANVASVKSAVKNINTSLVTESAEEGEAAPSMSMDEAMIKASRAGYGIDAMVCTKDGIDIMFAPQHNRFVVVSTDGANVDATVTDVLFPQDIADEAHAASSITEYITMGGLTSTRVVSMANENKMAAYKTAISGASQDAPKTVQASNASDLASLAAMSNGYTVSGAAIPGASVSHFENVTIELTKDIYLGSTIWSPFGETPDAGAFLGKINGNGHTIYGLSNSGYDGGLVFTTGNTHSEGSAFGLVAYPGGSVKIENVNLENVNIDMEKGVCIGAFVGYVKSGAGSVEIKNCTASGTIAGKNDVGGFVGKYYGKNQLSFINCTNNINVNLIYAEKQTETIISTTKGGAFLGYVSNPCTIKVTNCTNNGDVLVTNTTAGQSAYAGGIIGGCGNPGHAVKVYVTNYTNNGNISAKGDYTAVGEIMGQGLNDTILIGNNVFNGTATFGNGLSTWSASYYVHKVSVDGGAHTLLGYTNSNVTNILMFTDGATVNGVALSEGVVYSVDINGEETVKMQLYKTTI